MKVIDVEPIMPNINAATGALEVMITWLAEHGFSEPQACAVHMLLSCTQAAGMDPRDIEAGIRLWRSCKSQIALAELT